jgi:hypothetical protein
MSHALPVFALLGVLVLALPAAAQDVEKKTKTKRAPKVSNVVQIEETVIEGRVHKPEAFYILQRSNLNYNALEPKKTFIPKILSTVKKEPF